MDEAYLLAQRARILAIEAEIQGMIALNQYHQCLGQGIAYDDEPFFEKAEELKNIHNFLMENR